MLPPKRFYAVDKKVNKYKYDSGGTSGFKFTSGWLKMIRKQLRAVRYCAVISFLRVNNVLTLIAGLGLKQKIIVSERSHPQKIKGGMTGQVFKLAEWILYPFADKVVFQTADVADMYKKSIVKRSIVIPNPVNKDMPD